MNKTVAINNCHTIGDKVIIDGLQITIESIDIFIRRNDGGDYATIKYNYSSEKGEKVDSLPKQPFPRFNTFMSAIRSGNLKRWFYEFRHGHPFLLSEESDIICETRAQEEFKWMNDMQIQRLIERRVKRMYREKYPNARAWSLPVFTIEEE